MQHVLPKDDIGKPWRLRVTNRPIVIDGEDCWGECNYRRREVVVSSKCDNHGLARDTLLHEMIHKIMPFLSEEAVEHLASSLDFVLDLAEDRGILEL